MGEFVTAGDVMRKKVCRQCNGVFDTQFLCPKCGIQLSEISELSGSVYARNPEDIKPVGMATRFLAGLLLAQGLFYGLTLVGTGYFLFVGAENGWNSVIGRFMRPVLLLSSALLGSMLAGAGNPRAIAAGAALGLFHALAVAGVLFLGGSRPETVMQLVALGTVPVIGAAGARYGRMMWPPLSDVFDFNPLPTPDVKASKSKKKLKESIPIAWFRIIGGAALAIGCTVWAGKIREYIVGTSGGAFMVDSRIQVQFVTWVIASLAVVIGGIFAGASTRAGLRHGLLVGLISCLGIFVIYSQVIKEALPAEYFFAHVAGLPEEEANTPARIGLFLLTNAMLLSILGGWLGSTLLPRTVVPQKLDRGAI
jgi:hypothetical protein